MPLRRTETALAYVTCGFLAIYAPVETFYSWPKLGDPYYIIDVIAMALMIAGIVRSLRARPRPAPDLLTAAWAWAGANFWRAAFDRITTMQHGGNLRLGSVELDYVCAQLIVALVCLAIGVRLVTADRAEVTA